ncbi:hypothetical protein E1264_23355 [Actinomadura sp. KC216]|nr:hypothetical protein E1264_23355 [Actinomadura sp. KC216]
MMVEIERCSHSRSGWECRGSWTDSRGGRHSAEVAHTDINDKGRSLKARTGPFGVHAGSLWQDTPLLLAAGLFLAGGAAIVLLSRFVNREVAQVAQRILTDPGPALTLLVDRSTARRPDGQEYALLRLGDPELPLPPGTDAERYATLRRSDGRISSSLTWSDDEVRLLEPGRMTVEARIPHLDLQSGRPRIENAEGRLLAEIVRASGHTGNVYCIAAPDGTELGRFARLRRRTWALRLEPGCSTLVADMVLAHLFTVGRAA